MEALCGCPSLACLSPYLSSSSCLSKLHKPCHLFSWNRCRSHPTCGYLSSSSASPGCSPCSLLSQSPSSSCCLPSSSSLPSSLSFSSPSACIIREKNCRCRCFSSSSRLLPVRPRNFSPSPCSAPYPSDGLCASSSLSLALGQKRRRTSRSDVPLSSVPFLLHSLQQRRLVRSVPRARRSSSHLTTLLAAKKSFNSGACTPGARWIPYIPTHSFFSPPPHTQDPFLSSCRSLTRDLSHEPAQRYKQRDAIASTLASSRTSSCGNPLNSPCSPSSIPSRVIHTCHSLPCRSIPSASHASSLSFSPVGHRRIQLSSHQETFSCCRGSCGISQPSRSSCTSFPGFARHYPSPVICSSSDSSSPRASPALSHSNLFSSSRLSTPTTCSVLCLSLPEFPLSPLLRPPPALSSSSFSSFIRFCRSQLSPLLLNLRSFSADPSGVASSTSSSSSALLSSPAVLAPSMQDTSSIDFLRLPEAQLLSLPPERVLPQLASACARLPEEQVWPCSVCKKIETYFFSIVHPENGHSDPRSTPMSVAPLSPPSTAPCLSTSSCQSAISALSSFSSSSSVSIASLRRHSPTQHASSSLSSTSTGFSQLSPALRVSFCQNHPDSLMPSGFSDFSSLSTALRLLPSLAVLLHFLAVRRRYRVSPVLLSELFLSPSSPYCQLLKNLPFLPLKPSSYHREQLACPSVMKFAQPCASKEESLRLSSPCSGKDCSLGNEDENMKEEKLLLMKDRDQENLQPIDRSLPLPMEYRLSPSERAASAFLLLSTFSECTYTAKHCSSAQNYLGTPSAPGHLPFSQESWWVQGAPNAETENERLCQHESSTEDEDNCELLKERLFGSTNGLRVLKNILSILLRDLRLLGGYGGTGIICRHEHLLDREERDARKEAKGHRELQDSVCFSAFGVGEAALRHERVSVPTQVGVYLASLLPSFSPAFWPVSSSSLAPSLLAYPRSTSSRDDSSTSSSLSTSTSPSPQSTPPAANVSSSFSAASPSSSSAMCSGRSDEESRRNYDKRAARIRALQRECAFIATRLLDRAISLSRRSVSPTLGRDGLQQLQYLDILLRLRPPSWLSIPADPTRHHCSLEGVHSPQSMPYLSASSRLFLAAVRQMSLPTSRLLRHRLALAAEQKEDEAEKRLESCDEELPTHSEVIARHRSVLGNNAAAPDDYHAGRAKWRAGWTADSDKEVRQGVERDPRKERTDEKSEKEGFSTSQKIRGHPGERTDRLLADAEAERGVGGALLERPLLRMVSEALESCASKTTPTVTSGGNIRLPLSVTGTTVAIECLDSQDTYVNEPKIPTLTTRLRHSVLRLLGWKVVVVGRPFQLVSQARQHFPERHPNFVRPSLDTERNLDSGELLEANLNKRPKVSKNENGEAGVVDRQVRANPADTAHHEVGRRESGHRDHRRLSCSPTGPVPQFTKADSSLDTFLKSRSEGSRKQAYEEILRYLRPHLGAAFIDRIVVEPALLARRTSWWPLLEKIAPELLVNAKDSEALQRRTRKLPKQV